jgi:hypothetical protein
MNIMNRQQDRLWEPQPQAEALVQKLLRAALDDIPEAREFSATLMSECAVRLRDICDHVSDCGAAVLEEAETLGWTVDPDGVRVNASGMFPDLIPGTGTPTLWVRVESLDVLERALGEDLAIEGLPYSPYRRAKAFSAPRWNLGFVERNGHVGYDMPAASEPDIRLARRVEQTFLSRRRQFDSVPQGLAHTEALVDSAVAHIGKHWACHLWFKAERDYWMTRCLAGRWQKRAQDSAGIGFSNIDHHTYDGSRDHFRHTIRLLEKLGYELREMLYAGELAGWGSQVLEQPALRSTIFADVDLAPEELSIDFAHETLPPLTKHRRAGLLSVLHGESILEAGLNHVAGLHDWRRCQTLHAQTGTAMMRPFSDLAYLYQELTSGDWGAVDPVRTDAMEQGGHISAGEADEIRSRGAIVTHYENIERNDGYKGFNRLGIDSVLRKLDPRAYTKEVGA